MVVPWCVPPLPKAEEVSSDPKVGETEGHSMILSFIPFVLFALLANVSHDLALWAAFAAAFALALRDFAQRRIRLFDFGSLVTFGVVVLFAGFVRPDISVALTRLIVDLAFASLALVSLVLRNPLTVPDAPQALRRVRFRDHVLTAFWVVDFCLMAGADGFADKHKYLPQSLDGAAGLALLLAGLALTARIAPLHRHGASPAGHYSSSRAMPPALIRAVAGRNDVAK